MEVWNRGLRYAVKARDYQGAEQYNIMRDGKGNYYYNGDRTKSYGTFEEAAIAAEERMGDVKNRIYNAMQVSVEEAKGPKLDVDAAAAYRQAKAEQELQQEMDGYQHEK